MGIEVYTEILTDFNRFQIAFDKYARVADYFLK